MSWEEVEGGRVSEKLEVVADDCLLKLHPSLAEEAPCVMKMESLPWEVRVVP